MVVTPESVVVREDEPVVAAVDGEIVMLSVRAGAYFGLGNIGSEIWKAIETARRVDQICADLTATFNVERLTCEREVVGFLNELLQHRLIRLVEPEEE